MTARAMFDLSGKVALVTGSTRGLGYEMARALARQGAHVLVNGRDAIQVQRVVTALQSEGGQASAAAFDVAQADPSQAMLDAWWTAGNGIDILVNNVGIRDRRDAFALETGDFQRLFDVNVMGPLALSRACAARLIEARRPGRIINITSIAGQIANSGDAAYTTAKGALSALTRALAAEWGTHGITVNAVAPGFFATEQNAALVAQPEIGAHLSRRTSLGRWGKPAEIAGAVVFLASDEAAYVTGETLAVDGGYLAHF